MKIEQVLKLVDAVSESGLSEFELEEEGIRLSMKKNPEENADQQTAAVQTDIIQQAAMQTDTVQKNSVRQEKTEVSEKLVKSPLVGTFYVAPAEDAEAFVKVGDKVEAGQIVAIVEAMKLMNEIESEHTGVIAEVLAENGQTVEYGQPLFVIR